MSRPLGHLRNITVSSDIDIRIFNVMFFIAIDLLMAFSCNGLLRYNTAVILSFNNVSTARCCFKRMWTVSLVLQLPSKVWDTLRLHWHSTRFMHWHGTDRCLVIGRYHFWQVFEVLRLKCNIIYRNCTASPYLLICDILTDGTRRYGRHFWPFGCPDIRYKEIGTPRGVIIGG